MFTDVGSVLIVFHLSIGYLSRENLGRVLFEEGIGAMFREDQVKMNIPAESTALLQISSCFGDHKASLLLATIHLSGLGRSVDQQQVQSMALVLFIIKVASETVSDNTDLYVCVCSLQGHIYSLIGALGDNRFALMHAGYKHTQGIDGFPKDFDMAYSYYSNVGAQSNIDSSKTHKNTVSFPNGYQSSIRDLIIVELSLHERLCIMASKR